MTFERILYETRGDVALVTLNRPDKLNAWTPGMAEEQAEMLRGCWKSPEHAEAVAAFLEKRPVRFR